jgi:hypothetical protein
MFGHADAVRARRVDDQDAAGARGVDVDVVDAGAGAPDDTEVRCRGEKARIDGGRAADEQRVSVGEVGSECVGFAS